ncbi:hypothetical protein ASPCAL05999 [Aspergillus calidoustus]|uniref:F-box domain-containing protein n=1 Tax=Aspergillus calidoustus TaxID=454130 RepID=A0A0U5FZB4_ASPCI|nr:hypothetical protein ASPCAL05999 [Aspergillus calidoustus]
MAHLSDLPVSILIEIFEYTIEDCDYLPLLLISRHLRGIAEDVIYRDITENLLHVPDPRRRLCLLFRTLLHRPDLASRVRNLTIKCARDILSLPVRPSAAQHEFIQELQRHPGATAWIRACENNLIEPYIMLLIMLTPNLLHLEIEAECTSRMIPEMFDPKALALLSDDRRFTSLRSLTYGSGRDRWAADMTPFASAVPFLYLPNLEELHLTGLFGRFHGWLEGGPPTTRIKHLSLRGFALDMGRIDEVLAACPRLVSFRLGARYKPSGIFQAYGNLGRAFLQVRETIEVIDISYGEGIGFDKISPPTPHPHAEERMCVFHDFPSLYDLRIPMVAYLGAVLQEAPDLEAFLPKGLETLRFYDDIWAVNAEESAELYWSTLFHRLHKVLSNNSLPNLSEINFFIHESAGWFDFEEAIDGIKAAADRAGVAIRYWGVADDQ